MERSLHCLSIGPDHLELVDGRVVNLSAAANEEDQFFVVCSLKRGPDAWRSCGDRGDLDHVDSAQAGVFRVVGKGVKGRLAGVRQFHVASGDAALPASGEDVFTVHDGVKDQIADIARLGLDEKALVHVSPGSPMVVCEGLHTATALLRLRMFTQPANLEPEVKVA